MSGLLIENTLLRQTEAAIERKVPPNARDSYLKIVVAGMKYGLAKGKDGALASIKDSKDPVADAVVGAINVVGILRQNAKGTMPIEAMVPAAMTLLLHTLDFAEKTNLVNVTPDVLDRATLMFMDKIMRLMKMTPEEVSDKLGKVHDILRDPDMMAKYKGQQNGASKLR
jgi:hypothetical protein